MANLSVNLSGAGNVVADTLVVSGATTLAATTVSGGNLTMGSGRKLIVDTSTDATNCPIQFAGDPNTGLRYVIADRFGLVANGGQSVSIENGGTGTSGYFDATLIRMPETAAPSPIANYSLVYSLDVAGKTQLTAKQGAAGTVVALAIEV